MRRAAVGVFLAICCGLCAAAGPVTRPGTAPADTETITIAPPAPMPRDFDAVTERSIFVKGRQEPPRVVETVYHAPPADMVIFNGVTETDNGIVAFIEDTGAGAVRQMRVGDAVAGGKIAAITLDALDFEAGGHVRHVSVGQNLAGGDAWGQTYGIAPATQSSPGPTTDVSNVIERMKQRRLQESGGQSP